ncbi:hypothetical protein Bca101_018990 [Brassica carinata]
MEGVKYSARDYFLKLIRIGEENHVLEDEEHFVKISLKWKKRKEGMKMMIQRLKRSLV